MIVIVKESSDRFSHVDPETCSEELASQSHVRTTQMRPLVLVSSLNRNTSVFISGFASQVVDAIDGMILETDE